MVDGPHNPGVQLDLAWLEQVRINLPAVLRRAGSYGTRRTVKQQWQAAWLLKAVTCIDLTTLAGDDTETNTARLCLKAARPVRKDLLQVGGQAETPKEGGVQDVGESPAQEGPGGGGGR